jgi:hypothetical protein
MASAGASGTVTVEDRTSKLKLYVAELNRNSQCFADVCGEQTVDCNSVSHWATCFRKDVPP